MSGSKGLYVLLVRCDGKTLRVGSLGLVKVPEGVLAYVGSAKGPGGLDARVRRHMRRGKKRRWHIDYLTEVCEVLEAWTLVTERDEGWLSDQLRRVAKPLIKGFGCSDRPQDGTHLYLVDYEGVEELLLKLGFKRLPKGN